MGEKWAKQTSRHFTEETEMAHKHEKMPTLNNQDMHIETIKKYHFLSTKLAATKKSEITNNWKDYDNRNFHLLLLACRLVLPLWKTVLSSEVEHRYIFYLIPGFKLVEKLLCGCITQETCTGMVTTALFVITKKGEGRREPNAHSRCDE